MLNGICIWCYLELKDVTCGILQCASISWGVLTTTTITYSMKFDKWSLRTIKERKIIKKKKILLLFYKLWNLNYLIHEHWAQLMHIVLKKKFHVQFKTWSICSNICYVLIYVWYSKEILKLFKGFKIYDIYIIPYWPYMNNILSQWKGFWWTSFCHPGSAPALMHIYVWIQLNMLIFFWKTHHLW